MQDQVVGGGVDLLTSSDAKESELDSLWKQFDSLNDDPTDLDEKVRIVLHMVPLQAELRRPWFDDIDWLIEVEEDRRREAVRKWLAPSARENGGGNLSAVELSEAPEAVESGHRALAENEDSVTSQEAVDEEAPSSGSSSACDTVPILEVHSVPILDRREAFRQRSRNEPVFCEVDECGLLIPAGQVHWARRDWKTRRNGIVREPLVECVSCHGRRGGHRWGDVEGSIMAKLSVFGASSPELARSIGVSVRTVRRGLKRLVDDGRIERRGEARRTRYFPIREARSSALGRPLPFTRRSL